VSGTFQRSGNLGLLYQSKQNRSGKALTATSLAFSQNLTGWIFNPNNPVLAGAMSWQGKDSRGRAYRVGTGGVIDVHGMLIAYYRDRGGRYPGLRATGVATSPDGVNWHQVDEPFMTVEDAYRIIPKRYFTASPVFTHGRMYINHATIAQDYVYLLVNLSVDGKEGGKMEDFIIRGKDPLNIDSFEFVPTAWIDGKGRGARYFYFIDGKWVFIRNTTSSGKRYFGMSFLDNIEDEFSEDHLIPNHLESNPRDAAIFFYKGKYHFLYSDRQDKLNIHLLSEK
jgi:hypothetical protein